MPARAQLKAFPSRASFVSKPAKTSLTNLTNAFCEAFLFDWALGFLLAPVGGTRLQETAGEEPPAVTGFVQMPVVWQKLTSTTHGLSLSCLSPAIGEVRFAVCGISAASMLLGNVSQPTGGSCPCLGGSGGAGAGGVAAACPFVLSFIVTQLRSEQIWCLKAYILLNFEALQTRFPPSEVDVSPSPPSPSAPLWLG